MTSPRISARVTPETRDLVHTAADIKGVSVADFLAASAVEEAHRIIEQERIVNVSAQYAQSFFAALKTPPQPNKALRQAVKEHRST